VDVGIVGLGLIGGSIGLALRRGGLKVTGFDPDETALQVASERGCIDMPGSLEEACQSEVIFVCAPPPRAAEVCRKVLELAPDTAVITDATSTKTDVMAAVADHPQFVPGHPMAGAESSGATNARADLFQGATWILTPGPSTSEEAVANVELAVRQMGANPIRMAAAAHDTHVAVVSHLPHVFAGLLVKLAAEYADPKAAGGSWRDLTRVAGVDPELWMQILTSNREQAAKMISESELILAHLRKALIVEDEAAVRTFFEQAREAKGNLNP